MTRAQLRLLDSIRRESAIDSKVEYWPVVNDWVKDAGPARSLALHNINRTVDALLRSGLVTLDEDGYFELVSR